MKTMMITTGNVIRFTSLFGLILLFGLVACAGEDGVMVKETAVSLTTIPATLEPEQTIVIVLEPTAIAKPAETEEAVPELTKEAEPAETAVPEKMIEEPAPDGIIPELWHPIRSLGLDATYGVDISSDGNTALLGSTGLVSIVDLNDFTSQQIFNGNDSFHQLQFSPDSKYILVGHEKIHPILLDRSTTELVQIFDTLAYAPIAFSPDGTKIAGRRDNKIIEIWDIASHQLLITLAGHTSRIDALDFSPDGTQLASASADNSARIWDVATGEEIMKLDHYNSVNAVAYAPNGQYLATDSKLWDAQTGEEIDTSNLSWGSNFVTFSPDSQLLAAVVSSGSATLINVPTWESSHHIDGSNQHNKAAFSADGQQLLLGSNLWDVNSGLLVAELGGHSADVFYSTLSADGQFAATGSIDQTVKVWNVATGTVIYTLTGNGESFHAVAFSSDCTKLLATDGDDVRMWDMAKGEELHNIHYTFGFDQRRPVGFIPDGTRFFTTDQDGNLMLHDVATGSILQSFDHGDADVYSASFTPDGKTAVTGSEAKDDTFIRLWDVETGQMLQEHSLTDAGRVETVAFSPDGTQFISLENGIRASDPSVLRVWDASTGQEINTIMTESLNRSAAYFPDGRQVLLGGPDGAVIIDIVTGQTVESIVGRSSIYFNDIEQVAVSTNGERILFGASKLPLIFERTPFMPLTDN